MPAEYHKEDDQEQGEVGAGASGDQRVEVHPASLNRTEEQEHGIEEGAFGAVEFLGSGGRERVDGWHTPRGAVGGKEEHE